MPTKSRLLETVSTATATALLDHLERDGKPPPGRRVFVNRTLRMETIRYLGFDLDWTLADYERLPLEHLTFDLTIDRLIDFHGYPETIRQVKFRPDFPRRGLLLDKEAGTVLRMNRHRYVNLAYFGRERLDREELKRLYRYEPIHPASDRFYHLDSLFELPEANLYAELIDLANRDKGLSLPSSWQIFDDLRAAVDWVHQHGALKTKVLANLELYLHRDVEVGLALLRLALNGRRMILLTNSDWEYARSICSFLFDGLLPGLESWRDLFDLVVVEAGKPDFFRSQRPFEVIEAPPAATRESDVPAWGGVYRGGCLDGFMRLIGEPGEHVLYVGDHIYGDIVSSKLESTWRTALIVRELEEELSQREENASDLERQIELQQQMTDIGHEMDHLRDVIAVFEGLIGRSADLSSERLDALHSSFDQLRRDHFELLQEEAAWSERLARGFNPYWGSFFKQGTSKTRFASQLESYSCLYTSRVSNFAYYGANRYFRVSEDPMMHELEERR
ncbi:MAG: HAD-IG family 5'-nucleotidase [Thermoanaerobaculia bacterium]